MASGGEDFSIRKLFSFAYDCRKQRAYMPEFPSKLAEIDTLLERVEEQARRGVIKDEAFALALELEQSELNILFRDLVLMGRARYGVIYAFSPSLEKVCDHVRRHCDSDGNSKPSVSCSHGGWIDQ